MQYQLTGPIKFYFVGIIFTAVGCLLALILPWLLTPQLTTSHQIATATITDFQNKEDGKLAEIYQFTDQAGATREGINWISSSKPAYQLGENIQIAYLTSEPASNFIVNDLNLQQMIQVLTILGGFFALLGILILVLKALNLEQNRIDIIAGTIGALAYAIPATFLIPLMYFAHAYRPNLLFAEEDLLWTDENLILMAIFTSTGLLTLLGLAFMLNHYRKTGSNTWSKHY